MKKHNSDNLACYYTMRLYIIQYKEAIKNWAINRRFLRHPAHGKVLAFASAACYNKMLYYKYHYLYGVRI